MKGNQKQKKKKVRLEWRRIFVGALAVVLVLAMLLPLISSAILNAHAATQSELKGQISSLKDSASEAAARKKEYQQQLDAIQNDKAQAQERKRILSEQLNAINAQVTSTETQINVYNTLIAEQEAALAEAQTKEQTAYERFCQRARSMEEAGTVSYWSVLFSAKSYSDLLDRLALVDEIMAYDNGVVESLTAARQEVEDTLAALNESKAELDEQKRQLDIQYAEQAAKVSEAQALFNELANQAEEAQALVEAEEAEIKRLEQEQAQKEKELQRLIDAQKVTFTTGSGYAYPLPAGNVTVTSQFGPRTHPITGKYHNHTGADIAAPGGTNIYAVQGGVVQTSAYAPSSYGEYVVINHGNGVTTLYAHMQRGSRKVKEGDVVSQGQVLGLVGMTGSATGNHLHLELRKNGVRQNPLPMFPSVKFIYW